MPGAGRHLAREPGADIGDTVTGQRRDHEGRRKLRALVDGGRERQQRRLVDQIDLVEDQEHLAAKLGNLLQDRLDLVVEPLARVDQKAGQVGILRAAPGAA